MKRATRVYRDPCLPFAECRHSVESHLRYRAHAHKALSIGAIERGVVDYVVDGRAFELEPGSLALINPGCVHSCNPRSGEARSYYVLFLDLDWCLSVQRSLWEAREFSPLSVPILRDNAVYSAFIAAMIAFTGRSELLEKEQLLAAMAQGLFAAVCSPGPPAGEPSLLVEEVKEALTDRLSDDLSLSDIASELGVNPYTLLRQFKAATGLTPHAFRMNARIELAKVLLREGRDIADVALECGFFDQSHFHRNFRALTASTPGEYRLNFVQ